MPRIPYSTKYTVKVSGSMWKPVTCENCGCEYAYQVKHQTDGSATNLLWLNKEGAIRNAENNANQSLETYLKNTDLNYHCPNCGCYQTDMIRRMKNSIVQRSFIFGFLAFVIVVIITASNTSVAFYSVTAGIVTGIVFLTPLLNFNPNINANSRINQEFSEDYPVKKMEKAKPILTESVIERIKPFAVELFQRVNADEEMEIVAKSIAKRASVSPEQVVEFAYLLAQVMKEKK